MKVLGGGRRDVDMLQSAESTYRALLCSVRRFASRPEVLSDGSGDPWLLLVGTTMAVKPQATQWIIREQIIEDPVSGLTFQFEVMPKGDARLRVYGDLPFGNREFIFDSQGKEAGAGTAITGLCRPSWLHMCEP